MVLLWTSASFIFGIDETSITHMSVKLQVSLKISQVVAYLHAQVPVIIHRDIEPENILVANDFNIVKLCDMGLSKLKTMNTVMTTLAEYSLQPGTSAYQAPEVLLSRQSASLSTDIWSLSCTLLEIMTELPVWELSEEVEYIIKQMRNEAEPDGLKHLKLKRDSTSATVCNIKSLLLSLQY